MIFSFQIPGRLKLTNQGAAFKNNKTGKVDQIQASDIESIKWMRLAATHGLHIMLKNGTLFRFGGFNENVSCFNFFSSKFILNFIFSYVLAMSFGLTFQSPSLISNICNTHTQICII